MSAVGTSCPLRSTKAIDSGMSVTDVTLVEKTKQAT